MIQTYVFNGIEIKLTGRKASKEVDKVSRRQGTREKVTQILYEITPKSTEDGSWKKWVEMTELHTVLNDPDEK